MNCERARRLLDDYLDGALDRMSETLVRQHLQRCPACRRDEREIGDLLRAARALPDAVEPARELWTGIAVRLDRPAPRRSPWAVWLLAASVLLAMLGAGYFTLFRDVASPAAIAPASATRPAVSTALPAVHDAEQSLVETKQLLRAALERQRETLSPETQAMVDTNLAIIENAIDRIRSAVEQDPGNGELNRMLVAYHRQELELLQRVTRQAAKR